MEIQTCLRCNLPIRRNSGCICTSPNGRIYNPNEPEYLKPSTAELPLRWLTLFMERREIYRYRGDFFAYALNNRNEVVQINELENYFDLKCEVLGAPEPYIRRHYSYLLYSIVKGEVEKSISLMNVALSTSDYTQGKHLLHRYIRGYDDILQNMRKIEKPSDNYDALQNAFDGLNTFLELEKGYYFPDKLIESKSNPTKQNNKKQKQLNGNPPNKAENIEPHELKEEKDQKPYFRPIEVNIIFDLIKDYFDIKQQNQLKKILQGKSIKSPLLFNGNGNQLTDTFKKLFESEFIINCLKQDLENWILMNFRYMFRGVEKMFTTDYLDKCISRNYYHCKNPIIKINQGVILKNTEPYKKHIKKY